MEADSKDLTIEQLQERINNLNNDLVAIRALVPTADLESSLLSTQCKYFNCVDVYSSSRLETILQKFLCSKSSYVRQDGREYIKLENFYFL